MPGKGYADALVAEFGRGVGIDELTLDKNNYCCLTFDDLVVNLEYDEDEDRFVLYSFLGVLASERVTALEALLAANFFWQETSGATLSLERATDGIVLMEQIPLEGLEMGRFEARLERFVDAGEGWRRRLESSRNAGLASSQAPLGGIWG